MIACCVVMGYLMCFVGRVIFRTVYIILLPTVLVAVFILIGSWRNGTSEVWKRVVAVSLILLTGIWLSSAYKCTQILGQRKNILEQLEREHLVLMDYESANADKTFIFQGHNVITYKLPDTKPITNATSMGGSLWRSNYSKHFQQVNNIEQFNWTVFELPHIYFLGRFNENTVRVLDYLQRDHGCKGVAIVEQLEEDYDVYCMKFVYEDNLSDYASYYTVVDGVFVEVAG